MKPRARAKASTTEEPDAGKLHVRVCGGGSGQPESLRRRPAAAGWLYVYYFDAPGQVFEDLRPDPRPWLVQRDQRLPLTLPARINPPAGRPAQGRFLAVLTRVPLPASDGAAQPALREFLDVAAEEFVVCGDHQ